MKHPNTAKTFTKPYYKVTDKLFVPIELDAFNIAPENTVTGGQLPYLNAPENPETSPHEGPIVYETENHKLVDCWRCGHIHVAPVPKSDDLDEFYKTQFYTQERKSDYFSKQNKQLQWWNQIFDLRLSRFEEVLGRCGTILDVGCGPGFFLDRARRRGWQILGIEPARDAARYARDELGLKVFEAPVEKLLELTSTASIDVIYSHGVIEHLQEPISYLRDACKTLEKKSGIIFTSAANDFSLYQAAAVRTLDLEPWWIIAPEHLNYFTVQTLASVHEKVGFTTTDIRTSFPIDQFLLMGSDYVSHPELGAAAHLKRTTFEAALIENGLLAMLDEIERSNARLGVGRQTEYIGVIR